MLQFPMPYVDVLFPLNLPALTYRCSDADAARAVPGMIVTAPLRRSATRGVIVCRRESPPQGTLKEISGFHGETPALSGAVLSLIRWMADYYIAPEGIVLKYAVPNELFANPVRRRSGAADGPAPSDLPPLDEKLFAPILSEATPGKYETMLVRTPSRMHEFHCCLQLIRRHRGVIVLLPEVSLAEQFFRFARSAVGERVRLLHGNMAAGLRSEAVESMLSGSCDVAVGTKQILCAPLKRLSHIAVMAEESRFYKIDEGFRYHIRDAAVMRGYLEKVKVILSSPAPSIDSYANAVSRKYRLVRIDAALRPQVRVIDITREKKRGVDISRPLFEAARSVISSSGRVLFMINRRGYASAVVCEECGHTEVCPSCSVPLSYSKKAAMLRCRYCGTAQPVPDHCSNCRSTKLSLAGSGTERLQETIHELYDVEPVRFDRDAARKKEEISRLLEAISGADLRVVIGTRMLTGRIAATETFPLAAVLGIDSSLNLPDFRASERAYQELTTVLGFVRSDGRLLIQTRHPDLPLFRHFSRDEYDLFAREEIRLRREFGYPPANRMVAIMIKGDTGTAERCLQVVRTAEPEVAVLGPVPSRDRRGREVTVIIFRHGDRKRLNRAARACLSLPAAKNVKIEVDVDPL